MQAITMPAQAGKAAAPRPLAELENTIRAAAVFELEGALTVGVCLMEAKSQLPHGAWLPWLRHMGIDVSYANRRMRLAAEIPAQSPLAHLTYSQAMALLPLPREEREEFAAENAVQDKSAAEIRRLVRERDELAARMDTLRGEADAARTESEALRSRIETMQRAPAQDTALRAQAARYEAELAEAAQAAEEAEQRAAQAEAELRRAQQTGGQASPLRRLTEAVDALLLAGQTLPYQPETLTGRDAAGYRDAALRALNWANAMLAALDGEPLAAEAVIE